MKIIELIAENVKRLFEKMRKQLDYKELKRIADETFPANGTP